MKILLVDDDKAVLECLQTYLTAHDYAVEVTDNPKLALRMFRQAASDESTAFDVVITDFNMPGWSGLTLSMHIADCCRVYEIKAPVICLTGNAKDVRRMNERDGKPLSLILEKGCNMSDIQTAIKCVTERADETA